jgi:hypothetical protein
MQNQHRGCCVRQWQGNARLHSEFSSKNRSNNKQNQRMKGREAGIQGTNRPNRAKREGWIFGKRVFMLPILLVKKYFSFSVE